MVTARILPDASEMSSEAKKQTRPSTSSGPAVVPRLKQGPYLAPRLATACVQEKSQELSRVASPRLTKEIEGGVSKTISPNVTPRSTARRSRIGGNSAQPTPEHTPTSTPTSSRPPSTFASVSTQPPRPLHAGRRAARSEVGRGVRGRSQLDTGSVQEPEGQFFLANDAPARRGKSPSTRLKSSAFIYANGEEESLGLRKREDRRMSRSPGPRPGGATAGARTEKRRISSRSTPAVSRKLLDARNVPAAISPPGLSIPTPDLRILSRTIRGAAPRPKSPLKKFEIEHASSAAQRRRSSIDSGPSSSRQASGVYGQAGRQSFSPMEERPPMPEMIQSAPSLPALLSPLSLASPISPPVNMPPPKIFSVPGSPTTKREPNIEDEAGTAIAEARRERKILDLEISNSSLLAFNRLLERENRKLKSDLRRYRRMTSNSAITGDAMPSPPTTVEGEDERVEVLRLESESELDEEASDSEDDLSDGRQAEQRARDRRRLRRDLARHKQLLDDSRGMNQSIKHCLDVTDMLIADARRALEQKVEITDDDLRGKVLQMDDMDEDPGPGRGLLSPVKEANILWNAAGPSGNPLSDSKMS